MSYYYEHRNKDSELNWSYYVTILGTNSWETHRNPPTVWRLIIGCSTLEEAKELEAEAQRRSPDYGYKKITISQQKPAYDYYNDLNVSFVRFDDIMYDWNRARNIEQLRKAIDQESKSLDEINTNDKHKIIVDIEVWRMNDKTYRIRAAKPVGEQHQSNPMPSYIFDKEKWRREFDNNSDRLNSRQYGDLTGKAYTKAVKFVEKHGALNRMGEYGSIQIDPEDFHPDY